MIGFQCGLLLSSVSYQGSQ